LFSCVDYFKLGYYKLLFVLYKTGCRSKCCLNAVLFYCQTLTAVWRRRSVIDDRGENRDAEEKRMGKSKNIVISPAGSGVKLFFSISVTNTHSVTTILIIHIEFWRSSGSAGLVSMIDASAYIYARRWKLTLVLQMQI